MKKRSNMKVVNVFKKLLIILKYILGGFLLLCSLLCSFDKSVVGYIDTLYFLSLSFIVLPTFDMFCKSVNKKLSFGRKIALVLGTLFLPFIGPTVNDNSTIVDLLGFLSIILIYWSIIIFTNKKSYVSKDSEQIIEKSEKNDIFHQLYNKRIEKQNMVIEKRNAEIKAVLEYEQEVRNSFGNLNVLTVNAIASMVSETNQRHKSIINEDMPEINISDLVMSFCKDTQRIENEYEFNDLYTPQYYINKVNKDCSQLSN